MEAKSLSAAERVKALALCPVDPQCVPKVSAPLPSLAASSHKASTSPPTSEFLLPGPVAQFQ